MIMTDRISTEISMNMRISSSLSTSSNINIVIHTNISLGVINTSLKYSHKLIAFLVYAR